MAWNPATQKIVIFTYPMLDGAGDFSTTKKMIEKLISMEIRPENIYLVIVNIYDNIVEHYKNMELEFKKNCQPSQPVIKDKKVNVDFGHSRIIIDKDKIIKDESNFTITENIYYHISTILIYLRFQYNKLFDPDTEMDDSHLSLSDMKAELYKLLKKVKNEYASIKKQIIEDSDYKEHDLTKITQKIHDKFPYRCTLNGKILNDFLLSGTNVIFWYTWIKNVFSFLLPFKRIGVDLRIILSKELKSLEKKQFTSDSILRLLINDKYKIDFDKSFEEPDVKTLSFAEGGRCSSGFYSYGYSEDEDVSKKQKCLGINIVDTRKLEGLSEEGDYTFCYFGKVNENETSITPYGLLMMHKLKYLILMEETSHIKINKSCFDLILKYRTFSDIIFGEDAKEEKKEEEDEEDEEDAQPKKKKLKPAPVIEKVSENVLRINGKKTIEFYDVLDSLSFLNSLNTSKIYCVLTCDQSYFEGISLGKIVLFDLHQHKKQLSLQILSLYNHLSGKANVLPDIGWINYFEKNEECKITNYDKDSFTFTCLGSSPFKFEYWMIKDFYDKILVICSFLKDPAKRHSFLERLKTDFNFDKNFEALIKGESQFKSKKKSKNTSLKKAKKMSLKKIKKTSLKKIKKTSTKKKTKKSITNFTHSKGRTIRA
jgi:hypothetical protein